MIMVGSLIGDIPSGWLVSRIGERTSMIGASLVAILGLVVCTYAPNTWVLGIGVLLVGIATAVFALARHAFMTSFVPVAFRARSLSTLGGTFRLGFFVGPFISAAVIHLTGSTSSVFWIHIVGCLGAAVVLLLLPDPAATFGASRRHTAGRGVRGAEAHGLFRTMRAAADCCSRSAPAAALVGGIRAARAVILPLWAVSIGVSDANTAIIIGVAGAIDFALFYTSGQIMDRFGVLWSAVPSMVGLGIGHLVLAFTQQLPDAVVWFISVTMFLALANGIGSGILMTLGAAPRPAGEPCPVPRRLAVHRRPRRGGRTAAARRHHRGLLPRSRHRRDGCARARRRRDAAAIRAPLHAEEHPAHAGAEPARARASERVRGRRLRQSTSRAPAR